MSDRPGITGELRNSMTYEITTAPDGVSTASIGIGAFCDLCDAIDSIHEKLEVENESLKAELDRERGEWDYWESTHVELPKDADGEYIHIGDEIDTEHFGTVEVEGFVHNSIAFYNYAGQPAYLCTSPTTLCRHHHAPTVEDVLREFADECLTYATCVEDHEVTDAIERFAAKLRLAGDAE